MIIVFATMIKMIMMVIKIVMIISASTTMIKVRTDLLFCDVDGAENGIRMVMEIRSW